MPKRPLINSITYDLDKAEESEITEVVDADIYTEIELSNTEIIAVSEEVEINEAELVAIEEKILEKGLLNIQLEQKEFDAEDLRRLFKNEHARFMESSKKVGHALLRETAEGTVALQFEPPAREVKDIDNKIDVQLRPLENIRLETAKYGEHSSQYLRAETPNGTEMVAKRSLGMQYTENDEITEGTFWRFSPVQSHMWHGKLFTGAGPEELPIFTDKLSDEQRKDLALEIKDISTLSKHHQWQIDHDTVLWREQRSTLPRKPSQNEVMGGRDHSAFKAVRDFGEEYADELHPTRKEIIAKNNSAENLRKAKNHEKQHRHEWGHAMGYSLTHRNVNPQVRENLAAMPMYINTAMMISERTAKWFGLHRLNSEIKGNVFFGLIPSTDILDKGYEEFSFQEGNRKVVLHQDLNPWVKFPKFPKATDIGQTVMATYNLIVGNQPASVQSVQGVSQMPTQKPSSSANNATTTTTSTQSVNNTVLSSATNAHKSVVKTDIRNSIVQISCHGFTPNYAAPWRGNSFGDWKGSGVVFAVGVKKYILTNAHVVENHMDVRVRLASQGKEVKCRVIQAGYQCDLAVLEVDDQEFNKAAVPLSFGGMLKIGEVIEVVGFPTGGQAICMTSGPVSRIELGFYEEGGEHNLWVQTQAPLNPGNSGGPVIINNKIMGLAFQVLVLADGLNYVIPIPVIKHFLKDVFSPGGYKGFPSIAMDLQSIVGDEARKYFMLPPNTNGTRITDIDPLSTAFGKLKVDDIIIAIDGRAVSEDEKIQMPGIDDPIDLNYAWLSKFVGDSVNITVLRKHPTGKYLEQKQFDIALAARAGQTKKVKGVEYDKFPTFLIADLVAFQPLSSNMIETEDGKELITFHTADDKYLQDVPCINADDQLIRITCIFKSDGTYGAHDVENKFIDTVNNIKVNNMKELIRALRCPINGQTVIMLRNKEILVVKKLSDKELVQTLAKRNIHRYYSDDLANDIQHGLDPISQVTVEPIFQDAADSVMDLDCTFAKDDENIVDEEASTDLDATQDEDDAEDDEEELREDGRGFIATEDEELADAGVDLRSENLKPLVTNGGHPGMAAFSSTVEGIQQRALREREALAAARRERETTTTTTTTTAPVQFSRVIPEQPPKRRRIMLAESDSDDEVSNKAPEPAHKVRYRR